MSKPNGYTLHTGDNFAVIITGVNLTSENTKTGNMLQVWIIRTDVKPTDAAKQGLDSLNCGNCLHRGNQPSQHDYDAAQPVRQRTCYVNLGQGPRAVYEAYQRGNYPALAVEQYASMFHGRKIRFGAYGDPALIPAHIVAALASVAVKHTGYTHQWRNPANQWLKAFAMASCDTLQDHVDAVAMGWRTFRVAAPGDLDHSSDEILCPASEEAGKRTHCADCGLCNGDRMGVKSLFIPAHGATKKHYPAVITAAQTRAQFTILQ